ncbi:unnamed protein product [Brugia pahangi]|uniref:Secreted protein n=1 Tax=Brugia pahangi TaxID=6280 RepID=A0A0N4TXP8_BRUPA|nr:unnamed protein product [Brugia pahangi]
MRWLMIVNCLEMSCKMMQLQSIASKKKNEKRVPWIYHHHPIHNSSHLHNKRNRLLSTSMIHKKSVSKHTRYPKIKLLCFLLKRKRSTASKRLR